MLKDSSLSGMRDDGRDGKSYQRECDGMQPALTLPPALGFDDELARVHGILSGLADALEYQPVAPENGPSAPTVAGATDEFDWSVTLGNVDQLIQAREAAAAKLHAVEERALRAEARADEAERWLRRLHAAVLKGLPSTQK